MKKHPGRMLGSALAKVSFVLMLVITAVMGIFASYNYYNTRQEFNDELNYMAEMASTRLSKSLAQPLWDLDRTKATDAVHAEMMEKQLRGVIVMEADGKAPFILMDRNEKWDAVPAEQVLAGPWILKSKDVVKGEERLGAVTVAVTPAFKQKDLRQVLIHNAGITIAINCILFIAVMVCFNRVFIRPVRQIAGILEEGAAQANDTAGHFTVVSGQLAKGAFEQVAGIEETARSFDEMTASTKESTAIAAEARNLIQGVNSMIHNANAAMNDLTHAMDQISGASEETRKIVKTIDEIAFQTNLLALNAAVEAARAGEAGAGFAVVADEVRNLSIRSAEAAKKTSDLIGDTVRRIFDGNGMVGKTNASFQEVTEAVNKVSELVADISAAADHHSEIIARANQSVSSMEKVTHSNAASAEDSASASTQMENKAVEMTQAVDRLVRLMN